MDVIYTWVNGTDPNHRKWRDYFEKELNIKSNPRRVERHFREHDELRYSIRSLLASFPLQVISSIYIVVSDIPSSSPIPGILADDYPTAQVPQWLDQRAVSLAGRLPKPEVPSFQIVAHSEIFQKPRREETLDDLPAQVLAAKNWRDRVLPSFNSKAIESHLAYIPHLVPNVVVLNDDFFILKEMSTSDFFSPVLGPMFRLERGVLIRGKAPGDSKADPDGENKGLAVSNWLLDRRFGSRKRSNITHVAKSFSPAIWKEAQHVFRDALTSTAEVRFRGQGDMEVQMWFLLVHYHMEKHREALLWSLFFGRSDVDQDGKFSLEERQSLIRSLGTPLTSSPSTIPVYSPERHTLHSLHDTFNITGLPLPQRTRLKFSSMDGYGMFQADEAYERLSTWPSFDHSANTRGPPVCRIYIKGCFGKRWINSEEGTIEEIFKRVAFEKSRCGDCIIVALLSQSEKGLEVFLPPNEEIPPSEIRLEVIGLEPKCDEATFTLPPTTSIRARCVALIQRYAYTIGSSHTKLLQVRSTASFEKFRNSMAAEEASLLAINDDISDAEEDKPKGYDGSLKRWMEEKWPTPSPWEIVVE